MSEFLFEIYSEEIPSLDQEYAAKWLYNNVINNLKIHILNGEYFFTPRRIGFYFNFISDGGDAVIKVRGPKVTANEVAISGFLKKYNCESVKELKLEDGYFIFEENLDYIGNIKAIIEDILYKVPWQKSMRWGDHSIYWIRPIKSILAVLDKKVVPIIYGHIKASSITYGNWIEDNKPIQINSYSEYCNNLKKNSVILYQSERLKMIEKAVLNICQDLSLKPVEDSSLFSEVSNLVEYPYVKLGSIDSKFMALPDEILIETLRSHQKYIMLRGENGELAPYFIIVSNTKTVDDFTTVINGNEKVLAARLHDAQFFFEQDKKLKLIDRLGDLKKLVFHDRIGSYYDKVCMIRDVALKLADLLLLSQKQVSRAVDLMKNDLVTNIVCELPELQGIAGYYYALYDEEDIDVAKAIKEHYFPNGFKGFVPSSKLSIIIALSDKIVTLNKMFEINVRPTGSKDPFALRRAAIGIIRIVCFNKLEISIKSLISNEVIDFILVRADNMETSGSYDLEFEYIRKALR